MTERRHNFGAGPATLPEPVLRQAQQDIWNLDGTGIGVLEHSHRGKAFARVRDQAEQACRELAGIPDTHEVLFLQGGASHQFAMVPMNLLPEGRTADYVVTGTWSKKALAEAKGLGPTHVAATTAEEEFRRLPRAEEIAWSSDPVYAHVTSNNTIVGTQWPEEPAVPEGVPLVSDMSSDVFSRPVDVTRYGVIYAGAQKNLGPSGITLVIIAKDLVEAGSSRIPTILQYRTHAAERSLYNTPPTFGIYMMGEVFRWIGAEGGLAGMAERNEEKARLLYDYLDASRFFRGTAEPASRSRMNVCFRAPTEALEAEFIAEATRQGLDGLKGHRSVGGMRASIYNACSLDAVRALVQAMERFETAHRGALVG